MSIDFPEANYENLPFIAEFFNTISAVAYILVGNELMNIREKKKAYALYLIGVSTILLHATLWKSAQILDEIAILWLLFICLQSVIHIQTFWFCVIITIYSSANIFAVFLTLFTILYILIITQIINNLHVNKNCYIHMCLFGLAVLSWNLDWTYSTLNLHSRDGIKYKIKHTYAPSLRRGKLT